jgi:hypothetical protein
MDVRAPASLHRFAGYAVLAFDNALSTLPHETAGPDFDRLGVAVREFAAPHPYLLFRRSALARIRRSARSSGRLQARFEKCLRTAAPTIGSNPSRAEIKARARRLITTAFVALVATDARRDQGLATSLTALQEFVAAATWKERPVIRSFLDCAEIAVAVALAYDWLYDRLSPVERQAIEQALVRNALEPAASAYRDRSVDWPARRDNCTLVSNAGIAITALAMLPCCRNLCSELLRASLASAWNSFAAFAPDGAWAEGPSYWSLAARYAGLMVAALESTLGSSLGLADRPGLAQTGDFPLHAAGPFGAAFDFADSDRQFDVSPLLWLAHRYRRPTDGWLLRNYDGWYLPLRLIWPDCPRASPAALDLPTGKVFRGHDLACFRNTWRRHPRARPVFFAIKGGNLAAAAQPPTARSENMLLHAQADAGTFVVDGARRRWVIDLGADDYDLPGYFEHGTNGRSGRRWRYYRMQSAGHNTLVIDGRNQVPDVRAPILGSGVEAALQWVVFDLSAAYGEPPGTIRRGAALVGRQVLIEDEIGPAVSGTVLWTMHVSADPVALAGSTAHFRSGEDCFVARILEPAGASFELTRPPPSRSFAITDVCQLHGRSAATSWPVRVSELPRRDDAEGKRAAGAQIGRLQIVWPRGVRRMAVLLLPDCSGWKGRPPPVVPLDHWLGGNPLGRDADRASAAPGERRYRAPM